MPVTDFPEKGGDKPVSLRYSQWDVFDPEFAEMIRTEYPQIWRLGGNIEGNAQYRRLRPIVANDGKPETRTQERAIRQREGWGARHRGDFRIAGVVAQIKWLVVGDRGEAYQKQLIRDRIERESRSVDLSAGVRYANTMQHRSPFLRLDDGTFAASDCVTIADDASRTDGEASEIEVIASTERMATDGDVIEVDTWQTEAFGRMLGSGGPVLQSHDPNRVIGVAHRTRIDTDARALRAWYTHRTDDAPHAVEARRLRESGIRMPVSVRWIPGQVVRADRLPTDHRLYRKDPIKVSKFGHEFDYMPQVHRHAVLREISETPIPADSGALAVRAVGEAVGIPADASDLEATIRDALIDLLARGDAELLGALEPVLLRGLSVLEASRPAVNIHTAAWGHRGA
tara:strand:- start:271 stop:1467 length:1197 start_codon:yes stop_codon:yes gene_type:complete